MWLCAECGYISDNDHSICDGCLYRYDTFRITIASQEALDTFNDLRECDIEHNIFLLRCNRLDYLIGVKRVEGKTVTPQEELFASFFKDEKIVIKDMSVLELRAHRETLARIAFEARARLTAVDDEERERKAKARKDGKPSGFSTSLHTDELTSNAINKVKERGKKISKTEKTLAGLLKLGIDPKEAEKIMSAGTILNRVREAESKRGETSPEPAKNFMNPFAPKPVDEPQVEVTISEETATVVVTKALEVEDKPKPAFTNPFAK